MTPSWQIILSAIQANIRGAAYIINMSITQKITILAEADTEKGKNCDITPNGFVSTGLSWKNDSDPLALPWRVRRTCYSA